MRYDPYYDRPHWDLNIGVCTQHMLPEIPCPACVHEEEWLYRRMKMNAQIILISWLNTATWNPLIFRFEVFNDFLYRDAGNQIDDWDLYLAYSL